MSSLRRWKLEGHYRDVEDLFEALERKIREKKFSEEKAQRERVAEKEAEAEPDRYGGGEVQTIASEDEAQLYKDTELNLVTGGRISPSRAPEFSQSNQESRKRQRGNKTPEKEQTPDEEIGQLAKRRKGGEGSGGGKEGDG